MGVTSSHNLGDSLAIVGIVLAILCWIFVPTLPAKLIALAVCVAAVIYLSYRSHWTRNISKNRRSLIAIVFALFIVGVGGRQLYFQYYIHPSLSFKAFVTPSYQKGEMVGGLKWPEDNLQAVDVVTNSISEYPIHDAQITVQVVDKTDLFTVWGS